MMTMRNWLEDDHEFDTAMKLMGIAFSSDGALKKARGEMNDKTQVGKYTISTVKLLCDHGLEGEPLWFETMVNDGESWEGEGVQERYATLEQAKAGHAQVVRAYEKQVNNSNPQK